MNYRQTLTWPLLLASMLTTILAVGMAQGYGWPSSPLGMTGDGGSLMDYPRFTGSQLFGDMPGLDSMRKPDPNFPIKLGQDCAGGIMANIKRGVQKFPHVCCTISFFAPLCNEKNSEPK